MALFLNGIFNIVDPLLGFQLYIWCGVGILILTGIAALILHFGIWKPLTPMHGLYYEWKNGGNTAFIFDADLRGELVSERTAKCIFDYSKIEYELPYDTVPVLGKVNRFLFYYPTAYLDTIDPLHALVYRFGGVNKDVEIARALQGGEWERNPSVICGGVPVDIVIDTDNWTIPTSRQHKDIERCADLWNDANPDDQIHSYSKFGRYLLEGKISCPAVNKTAIAPWVRIDGSFPTEIEESEWVGKEMQMAQKADTDEDGYLNSLGVKVLIGGCAIGGLILIVRLLTWFFH